MEKRTKIEESSVEKATRELTIELPLHELKNTHSKHKITQSHKEQEKKNLEHTKVQHKTKNHTTESSKILTDSKKKDMKYPFTNIKTKLLSFFGDYYNLGFFLVFLQ